MRTLGEQLATVLPEHKGELSLTHNEHKSNYESAAEFLIRYVDLDEIVEGERERMVESDSIWCLQCYPHTPVGFYRRYASTIDALFASRPATEE